MDEAEPVAIDRPEGEEGPPFPSGADVPTVHQFDQVIGFHRRQERRSRITVVLVALGVAAVVGTSIGYSKQASDSSARSSSFSKERLAVGKDITKTIHDQILPVLNDTHNLVDVAASFNSPAAQQATRERTQQTIAAIAAAQDCKTRKALEDAFNATSLGPIHVPPCVPLVDPTTTAAITTTTRPR